MKPEATSVAKWAFGGATVLLSLLLFPPWRPAMPSAGLDPAWFMVIAHALTQGWQFGREVIFTYGPLGFLAPPSFFPGLYLISLGYWLVFYAAFAGALWMVFSRAFVAWWLVALVVLLIAGLSPLQDARVFAACVLLFVVGGRAGRPALILGGLLTILQAVAALMKLTYAAASFPTVILTDVYRYASRRSLPVFTPVYLLAYVTAYIAAGQDLSGLPTYLRAASEISAGYSGAMVAYAPIGEVAAYVCISILGGLIIVSHDLRARRLLSHALPTLIVFAIVIFLAAKAGFVRHDIGHAIIPWLTLPLVLSFYLSTVGRARGCILSALILISLVYFSAAHLALNQRPERTAWGPTLVAGDAFDVVRADLEAVGQFVFAKSYVQRLREWPEFLKAIRDTHPLPDFEGPTDISGGDQAILFAHAADYRPRPTFQSYSVYTSGLIARNAAFLRSEAAPTTFLLKVSSIDGRYPALDEGALWPELMRYYDIVNYEYGYAVLKRRATGRDVTLTPVTEASVAFGDSFDVTPWNNGILWVELDVKASWLGHLRNLLFKPALVNIDVTLDDGRALRHRLVPGMVNSGFVLSPYIDQTDQFVTLGETLSPRVTAFAIGPETLGDAYFQKTIDVRLKLLNRSGERERPAQFDENALARLGWGRALLASGRDEVIKPTLLPEGAVLAHAPTRLQLGVPADAAELSAAFGFLRGSWSDGGATTGACFRVSGESNGETYILHERCLDPANVAADREKIAINVSLGAIRPARVIFETLPGENTQWDWTYWDSIGFATEPAK